VSRPGKQRRQTERLKQLLAASQVLAQVEALDELLPALLGMAELVTHAEASSILLWDEERQVLTFTLARNETRSGIQKTLQQNVELKLGQGIAGWVAEHRKPLLVDDVSRDARFSGRADSSTGFRTRCLICVPMLHGEDLLGVVQVLNAKDRDCFDADDQELLESFAHLGAVAIVRRNLFRSRLEEQKMRSQLDAAAGIQSQFLPANPEGLEGARLWGRTRPAVFVGGDFYDFMNAATAVLCRFRPASGIARVVLAGHVPPLVVSPKGLRELSGLKGLPLGIEVGQEYEEQELRLRPGETLLLVTDGVHEARNLQGEFFGMQRVLDCLSGLDGRDPGPALLGAVEAWRAGAPANDDTTIVEMACLA